MEQYIGGMYCGGYMMIRHNYYCQQKCGFEDFDINEHDRKLKLAFKMNLSEGAIARVLGEKVCIEQCFNCMVIVGTARAKNKLIRDGRR